MEHCIGETDIKVNPADKLSNGNCFFAAGYPAVKTSGIRGFVTAGYFTGITRDESVMSSDNVKIGSVYEYEYSNNMNASFIQLEDSCVTENKIALAPNPIITGIAPEIITGASVTMYGGESGQAYKGKLLKQDAEYMNMKNIIIFSYISCSGDCGSPIVLHYEESKCYILGIHLGTIYINGVWYSYGRKAKDINDYFSLELNL